MLIVAWGMIANAGAERNAALYLEVFVNGNPTSLIATFYDHGSFGLGATPAELNEVGVKLSPDLQASSIVHLHQIPGLTYRYTAETQSIELTVEARSLVPHKYDAMAHLKSADFAQASPGVLLNYALYGGVSSHLDDLVLSFNGGSVLLDARAFGPYGTFSTSTIARAFGAYQPEFLRLETFWSYSDQSRLLTYRVGDTMTGGLAWTRPIRMAGVQLQREFRLRPDLITMPLLQMGGDTVVPSTVDIFINNTKVFSQSVPAGPFEIANIPVVTGAGMAEVVVRDAGGRETRTSAPIYASPSLLRPGLYEFSSEVGVARQEFGTASNTYDDALLASASIRYGAYDWLTVEGHAELAPDLLLLGFGHSAPIASWALASAAASASAHSGTFGSQVYLAMEFQLGAIGGRLSTQRTMGKFADLGTVTAARSLIDTDSFLLRSFARPPLAIDQLSLNLPALWDDTRLGLNLTHLKRDGENPNIILSAVYGRRIYNDVSLLSTAFIDLGPQGGAGLFLGLSMPLGGGTAATTIAHDRSGMSYGIEHAKARGSSQGDVGWHVRAQRGESQQLTAAVSYRAAQADINARLLNIDRSISATLELRGSIVALGDDVFVTTPIDDAFAVVDTGVPNIDVFHQNRRVATTNTRGRALVTGLNAYQSAPLRIDATQMPLDTELGAVEQVITPADRSGVLVKFDVRQGAKSATVILRHPDGSFLPVGVIGRLEGQDDPFVVGYDGQAFLTNLAATNSLVIELERGYCGAVFEYVATPGQLATIDPVICR